jgi:hypothetical protein
MGEQYLGEIRVRFTRQAADEKGPAGWQAHARLHITVHGDSSINRRQEEAVTRFDEEFLPVDYLVTGFESAQARADYTIRAHFADGQVTLRVRRETNPLEPGEQGVPVAPVASQPAASWDEPLRRIALPGEEEEMETKRRVQNERFVRPLTRGTFVHDHHRVEHVAVALYRLPLPEAAEGENAAKATVRQRVALYAVRQNQSSSVPFVVSIEPRPKDAEPEDPVFYIADTNNVLTPCRVLLDAKGRLLQWTTRYGTREVVYTLDDPVMRKREKRKVYRPSQDGPLLLRPPWY